jgi:hypothetical protein
MFFVYVASHSFLGDLRGDKYSSTASHRYQAHEDRIFFCQEDVSTSQGSDVLVYEVVDMRSAQEFTHALLPVNYLN